MAMTAPTSREELLALADRLAAPHMNKSRYEERMLNGDERDLIVAALRGVAQASWQPIKTAPKDRPIMLCVTGFLPCVGRWWPVDSCWTSFDWEGHFESDKETSDHVNGSSYEPTHWMPLPPGPSVSSTDGGDLLPKETIGYVNQYGGNCRDCADNRGVCPVSGLPCAEREKAIKWVVDAINYGVGAGFLRPSIPRPQCATTENVEGNK